MRILRLGKASSGKFNRLLLSFSIAVVATSFSCSTLAFSFNLQFQKRRFATKVSAMNSLSEAAPSSSTMIDMRQQMMKDGKALNSVSTTEFLVTIGVLLPIWATVMVPLTISYRIFKSIRDLIFPPKEFCPQSPFDSGYVVEAKDIVPRPDRKFDIVVLGATGFAGKLAIRHLAKTYGVGKGVKWAMAGRSKDKLQTVRATLAEELDMPELSSVDLIIADTSIPSTLPNLVRNTRAVVSTTGPFWNYGSAVVEFCAKFGTNYADITGESSWVKAMMTRWQNTAKKTGAKIISLAGHDCIPWDLSVCLLANRLKKDTGEDLVEVICIDEARSAASGGTIETILMGANGLVPSAPTDDPFRKQVDGRKHTNTFQSDIKLRPSKILKPWDKQAAYGTPFFMSIINQDVVSWSQALRGGAPLVYSEVALNSDFKTAVVGYFQTVLFLTGIMNPLTKNLLMKFALPKPGEGPSMDDMENNFFLTVTTRGIGSAGSEAEAVIYFPRDPGYLDTARMLVESGLSMALNEKDLPVSGGGFFSPGYGLGETLLGRLARTGTYFQLKVLKNEMDT